MIWYILCAVAFFLMGVWAGRSDLRNDPDHRWYFRWYKNHQAWKYKPMEED